MKPLAIWTALVGGVLGVLALVTTVTRDTTRVFVVVDSSFPMAASWRDVPGVLDDIDDERHAEFALATEKDFIHGWQPTLELGAVDAFAPCTFERLADYDLADEADRRILITNEASCDTTELSGWVVRLVE